MTLTTDAMTSLFTRHGRFLCARWARPIAPVMFGLADDSLAVLRPALTATILDAGATMADTDPETGANLMGFFVADWAELRGIPDLDRLTGIDGLPQRLQNEDARRYRLMRFAADGSIRAAMAFHRITDADHPAALGEAMGVNALLSFAHEVRPSRPLARLIRAAYDPVVPAVATDPAHALRLAARL